MPFGKYAGREMIQVPPEYLLWCLTQQKIKDSQREFYRAAVARCASYLKQVSMAMEPSPGREALRPFRPVHVAELVRQRTGADDLI